MAGVRTRALLDSHAHGHVDHVEPEAHDEYGCQHERRRRYGHPHWRFALPRHGPDVDENAPGAAAGEAVDRIALQASRIQEHFRLSAREAEVMELMARGNSVARIAEMLVVSENTVRTHSKRIYVKLDIHKRQELVDLIEEF